MNGNCFRSIYFLGKNDIFLKTNFNIIFSAWRVWTVFWSPFFTDFFCRRLFFSPTLFFTDSFFHRLFCRPLFPAQPIYLIGGTDRWGILFYAGSTTTDIGLLLVAPAPRLLPPETFSMTSQEVNIIHDHFPKGPEAHRTHPKGDISAKKTTFWDKNNFKICNMDTRNR
jgi:hypothetical protein